MARSSIKAVARGDVHKVWDIVLSVERYGEWRRGVSKAERRNEKQFVEYTRPLYPTTFTVTASVPYRRWEFDMENSRMTGHWTGLFTAKGAQTQIDFTQRVAVKSLFMRPLVRLFLKNQQIRFVEDLKRALL